MKIGTLKPAGYNPRIITDRELELLKKSLYEFGDLSGIVFNRQTGNLVGGHQRIKCLPEDAEIKSKKLKTMSRTGTIAQGTITIDGEDYAYREVDWPLEREKAANLAANKHGGDFDEALLAPMLKELTDRDTFDVSLTGFEGLELDNLIASLSKSPEAGKTDPDKAPGLPAVPITQLGDIYILGDHRLLCGDATKQEDVELLMDSQKADMVLTDPPYGVNYSNANRPKPSKKDLGRMINDDIDLNSFLPLVYHNLDIYTKDDSSFYIWYADKTTLQFYSALLNTKIQFNQMLVWVKPMLLGRARYQYAHEPFIFAVKGSPYHTDDRTKTTVWDFGGYDKSNYQHPTQKPVILFEEAVNNSSQNNNIILDLFLGSGSTLIACEKTGRICYGMEIDPQYCDVIVKRWEDYTGKKAKRIPA